MIFYLCSQQAINMWSLWILNIDTGFLLNSLKTDYWTSVYLGCIIYDHKLVVVQRKLFSGCKTLG